MIDFKKLGEDLEAERARKKSLTPEQLKEEERQESRKFDLESDIGKALLRTKAVIRGLVSPDKPIEAYSDHSGDRVLGLNLTSEGFAYSSQIHKGKVLPARLHLSSESFDAFSESPDTKGYFDYERDFSEDNRVGGNRNLKPLAAEVSGYFVPFKNSSGKTSFLFVGNHVSFYSGEDIQKAFSKPLVQSRPFDYTYLSEKPNFVLDLTSPDLIFSEKEARIFVKAFESSKASNVIAIMPDTSSPASLAYKKFLKEKHQNTYVVSEEDFIKNCRTRSDAQRFVSGLFSNKDAFIKPNHFYTQPNALVEDFFQKHPSLDLRKIVSLSKSSSVRE